MKLLNIIILLTFVYSQALAKEYVIVSNNKLRDISKSELKAIYLNKISFLGNKKIIPLNLYAKDPIRISFETKVLNMSFRHLKSYWAKQHYLGHRPPLSMKSQESVIAFIKKVDGAIGYIDIKNIDEDLKIIYRWKEQ